MKLNYSPRTPMPGVFLCGACTHPGGSVIAINGRNAAMEVAHQILQLGKLGDSEKGTTVNFTVLSRPRKNLFLEPDLI